MLFSSHVIPQIYLTIDLLGLQGLLGLTTFKVTLISQK